MKTYKLFRIKNGKLYPLYVEANREIPIGKWIRAGCGELVDDNHVKARGAGGSLSLRSGWHSTTIPFTDWIGARQPDGTLAQRKDTVWCECEVDGYQVKPEARGGFAIVPTDCWYYFKTNTKQKEPWIISDIIRVNRILAADEVAEICRANGIEPQPLAV